MGTIGVFQAALAAGAPWGRAAYGGAHPGVLPPRLRATSAAAAGAYGGLAYLVWTDRLEPGAQRWAYSGLSALFAVGTVMNALSRSPVERAVWTPVAGTLSIALWHCRPPAA